MTDSRFEKWATGRFSLDIFARGGGPEDYADPETCRAFNIWRAALEDRQEAAPEAGEVDKLWQLIDLAATRILQHMNDADYEISWAGLYAKLTEHKLLCVKDKLTAAYCFECDDRDRCASAETCYGHHEGYPRFGALSSGVPSEATPSKENAPPRVLKLKPQPTDKLVTTHTVNGTFLTPICGRCGEVILPITGCPCVIEPAAPAPEVQGTPNNSARLVSTTSRAGQNDACLEPALSVRADTGGPASFEEMATDEAYQREAIAMTEGTPQKETPPMQEFPQCGAATISNSGGTWKCQLQSGHKGDHRAGYLFWEQKDHSADSAQPEICQFRKSEHRLCGALRENHGKSSHKFVPEGVQGKEPQVWRPLVELVRREMMARFSDKLSMEEIASCAYAISTANYSEGAPPMKTFGEFWETVTDSEIEDGIENVAKRAYLSGEAAGRRSAAQAIKAVLENDAVRLTDLVGAVEKLCAELQEKTK